MKRRLSARAGLLVVPSLLLGVLGAVLSQTPADAATTVFAGNGSWGTTGDGGAATSAILEYPWGMAVDPSGNLFFADNYASIIREVDNGGIMHTVYGTAGTAKLSGQRESRRCLMATTTPSTALVRLTPVFTGTERLA
jgi:hypothetical protein